MVCTAVGIDPCPTGIVERDPARHGVDAVVVLGAIAGDDDGVRTQVGLDNAIAGPALEIVAIEVAIGVEVYRSRVRIPRLEVSVR